MENAKTITTFLMDGTLNGPKYVNSGESSQCLFVLPRAIASKLSTAPNDYPEYNTPGFYILTGQENGKVKVYIGESSTCKERISYHDKKPKFIWKWDTAYVYVSKTKGKLDATTIKYLEAKFIEYARRFVGDNLSCDNTANPKKAHLPKDQEATIKQYYNEAKMLLEFVRCIAFIKDEKKKPTHFVEAPTKGVKGEGIYDAETNTMIVLANSIIDPDCAASFRNKEGRKKLIDKYTKIEENGKLVTTEEINFSSPSAAAKFVLGRSANGLDEWKDKEGKSINDLKK